MYFYNRSLILADLIQFSELCGEKEIAVYSAEVKHPVAVTYAFQNLNHGSNLCDNEGRMAVPFRSDRAASEYFLPEK